MLLPGMSIPAILPPHAQIVLQDYLPSLIDTTVSLSAPTAA
jgi:hypothetical protein